MITSVPFDVYHQARGWGKRIPEGEPIILTSSEWSYKYARDIINSRWQKAETVIAENAAYAYLYARDVIKGRWSEIESILALDPRHSVNYSLYVINERFYQGEKTISESLQLDDYINHWFGDEPVIKKSEVDENNWFSFGARGYFAPITLFKSVSVLDMCVE